MRKEVLWAIVGGIILGLIVAFGVYRINSRISGNLNHLPRPTPTPKSNLSEFKIVLDKPEENDVVTEDVITVSGITKPLSWITFSSENSDYIIQSDTKGVFSQEVDLVPGVNQIKVTAFEKNGIKSTTQVLVVYSSSFQKRTSPTALPNNSTGSATNDIRQKVAQDVINTLSKPKAYIGTVTDITDATVQIKTMANEIRQISINSDSTTVVNSTGTTAKTVKTTDVAIGDFIVAMGYVDGNSVLAAQRILITDPVTSPKIEVSQGKLVDIPKKQISKNTDILIFKDGKTTTAKLTDIGTDDLIIYVTSMDDKDVPSVRSIFRISPPQG
ncbi:MAG TPA: hypothetical protein VKC53_03035 [Patescibacteria group bacterium]|nr:hypothetical protein [Patescibacteria group bacterium]